ncbi:hypothetical protein [Paracidovorax cattleyae]|uniref:hypothetical protein n=1 Tax=Paracidovorax cattleyae TaxID=80868 RepID=UPI0018AFCB4F|nr:hypothetical protein [Paracidovorax cattleyae]MBF9265404.1 hypothetical protein [Paracidovorax cattleyae]UYL85497.1 hypothetical protein gp42 [Acidovorax phage Aval]
MIRITILAALLLAGCGAVPPEPPAAQVEPVAPAMVRRDCPPLPELRAGASGLERRMHTQTIVRMYAGSQP